MNKDDARMVADAVGAAIARERAKTRDEMKAALAEARTNLLAEARALIAESRAAELERTVDKLLGSQSPQRLTGATAIVSLPSRRSA